MQGKKEVMRQAEREGGRRGREGGREGGTYSAGGGDGGHGGEGLDEVEEGEVEGEEVRLLPGKALVEHAGAELAFALEGGGREREGGRVGR
jgi:hypothetical protein